MTQYFRITAYNPTKDFSMIVDSNGKFEKLWQFSSYLVQKGFKIIEVGSDDKFEYGNIKPAEHNDKQIILRACEQGQAKNINNTITINNKKYII